MLAAAGGTRSQRGEGALFSAQDLNPREDAENFKELAVAVVEIGQDDLAFGFVDCLDHAEQQRDSDAINQFSPFEIDYQVSDPVVQHLEASPFYALAPQL